MKDLYNYTLEEYKEKILPNMNPRFRESVLRTEATINFAYQRFIVERLDMQIDKLRKKRRDARKLVKKYRKDFQEEINKGVIIIES
jgi:flagellar biosynthesis chaperone FliJ